MANSSNSTHDNSHGPTRRDFLKTSSAAVLAAAATAQGVSAAKNDTLRVGLIGCGGRGTGAAHQAIKADPKAELVAMGDAFGDQLERCLHKLSRSEVSDRVKVDKKHQFVGFDAFEGVIKNCDVVVLATPPAFRPAHVKKAVEAGKHLFIEKPIAVDAPGVRSVMESCRLANKKDLNVVTGLCYRYEFAKRAVIEKIHEGAIGDIVSLQCTYNTGSLWHKGRDPEWSDMEYQMRNWLYFDWLSGDHINEQHIHSLDKLAWAMKNQYPVKATSSGGRIVRTDSKYGNVYDHFNTTYEWADGVRGFSSCRQWANADTDVSDYVNGTKGVAALQSHRIDFRDGTRWQHQKDPKDEMYQNEHNALFAAIRSGDTINDGEIMCNSTMMAIMARMSAYTGKTITWDEAWNSSLDLAPKKYAWGAAPERPVSQPGVTAFV